MKNNRNHLLIAAALGLAFTAASVFAGSARAFTGPTVIYFVRHGENESSTPNQALTQQGEARAHIFSATVRDIPFGHVLSSHTTRSPTNSGSGCQSTRTFSHSASQTRINCR